MTSFRSLSLAAAFGGGILSFLAPCVLPLVPSYLSYLAGVSLEDTPKRSIRFRVTQHALWFVVGSTLLFTLMGAAAAPFWAMPASELELIAGCLVSRLSMSINPRSIEWNS